MTSSTATRAPAEETKPEGGRPLADYAPGQDVPLGGYAMLAGVYLAGVGALVAIGRRRIPKRIPMRDIVLLGIATHKLSRTLAKERVASPLRAPFAEYHGSAGAGMVHEETRGRGMRRAVGELVTCPFCVAPWIAAGLGAGYVRGPRLTRALASLFAAVTVSDFMHQLYTAARRLSG